MKMVEACMGVVLQRAGKVLDTALQRAFRPQGRYYLDARFDATNPLNHRVFTAWNTMVGNTQFGQPVAVNEMRSVETTLRLRF